MTRSFRNPKILVLHPGALGDGLLSLPTIRGLRRQHPKHELIWVGHKSLGEVFLQAGEVHATFSFDSISVGSVSGAYSSVAQSLRSSHSSTDLLVGWMNDRDGYWKTWAENLGYARSIFRSPREGQLTSRHMLERYWEALGAGCAGICPSPVPDDFRTLQGMFAKSGVQFGQPLRELSEKKLLFLLHPGSGSPEKCVSPDIFSRMARKLITRFSGKVALIGGPADSRYLDPILSTLTDLHPPCFQGLDLPTVCGFFQQVHVFIGHDSGLSHLAANLGVPSLLLFGPTDPAVWAPRGAHIRVQWNQNLHFSPDDLCDSVEQLLQGCQHWLVA